MQSLAPLFKLLYTMKKIAFLAALVLALIMTSCNSCSNKKDNDDRTITEVINDAKPTTEMNINGSDTAEVMSQVNDFLGHLKQSDIDGAMHMVSYLDGDTIKQVPQHLQKKERTVLSTVLGASKYDIQNITFLKEKDCEVRIMVTLFDLPKGDTRPNQVGLIIKPVRRNGKWFLTLADTGTETNRSEIEN